MLPRSKTLGALTLCRRLASHVGACLQHLMTAWMSSASLWSPLITRCMHAALMAGQAAPSFHICSLRARTLQGDLHKCAKATAFCVSGLEALVAAHPW